MDSNEIDWVFQTDDEEVLETYRTRDNYLMERTPEGDDSRCAVYFSSNDLYFPNNRARFHERLNGSEPGFRAAEGTSSSGTFSSNGTWAASTAA